MGAALLACGLAACARTQPAPAGPTAVAPTPAAATATDEQHLAAVLIFAAADWYRSRPEPEQQWRGVLQPHEPAAGPAGRSALKYALHMEEGQLLVYAANVEAQLEQFAGRQVLVTGKLVDLSEEGFGQELWIASIAVE